MWKLTFMLVIPIPETSTSELKIFVLVFFSENCIQDGGSRGSVVVVPCQGRALTRKISKCRISSRTVRLTTTLYCYTSL